MATTIAVTLPRPRVAAADHLTVARIREYVTTSLSDAALQPLLDAALRAIARTLGPLQRTDLLRASGDLLSLPRITDRVVSVVEDADGARRTLATNDYRLSDTGRVLRRLRTGAHPSSRWLHRIELVTQRPDDRAAQLAVASALVRFEISADPRLASQRIGDWQETYRTDVTLDDQREEILERLCDEDEGWVH